jgi:hypothetical protein
MNKHIPTVILAAAGALLLTAAAHAGGASTTDLAFFAKDPGQARAFVCYTRRYDANHLAAHREQNVRDMTVLVDSNVDPDAGRGYTLDLGVHFRGANAQFQSGGDCSVSEDGMLALNCAVDCDGGEIDVKLDGANSLLVSIPDGVRIWDPSSGEDAPDRARFGADDVSFRLDRTDLSECAPLAADDDVKAMLSPTQ